MSATLLLDRATWDLVLDVDGDIAMATDPYSLAQDAASAIKTFLGEVYFDTKIGVPYLADILAKNPSPALLKARFVDAAKTVPGVASAQCFLTAVVAHRTVGGQVQVTSQATRKSASASFAVVNPQGG